jgi:hypothetical protein
VESRVARASTGKRPAFATTAVPGETPNAASGLVDPSGEPALSDQAKQRYADQAIQRLIQRRVVLMLMQEASAVLARSVRDRLLAFVPIAPVRSGPARMSFALCFQIRLRFIATNLEPPSWIRDKYSGMSGRMRRRVVEQYRDRDRNVLHQAANKVIHDAEFAGHIVDVWKEEFDASKPENYRRTAGRALIGAEAPAEDLVASGVSGGDASA